MIGGLTEQELRDLLLADLGRVIDAEFAPLVARIARMEAEAHEQEDGGEDDQ